MNMCNAGLVALIAAALGWAAGMSTAPIQEAAACLFAWTSQAHSHFALVDTKSVEHSDRFLRFGLVAHFDKCEPLRLPAVTVFNQRDRSDGPGLEKQGAQIIFGGRIR